MEETSIQEDSEVSQKAQCPLIREYTLNDTRMTNMIQGRFLTSEILGVLCSFGCEKLPGTSPFNSRALKHVTGIIPPFSDSQHGNAASKTVR